MGWRFDPERTAQAAGVLIGLSGGDRMPYLKLLKLLYLADRESLAEKHYPLTGDTAFAMDYGPVLTHVYDYIKCKPRTGVHIWARCFKTDGFDVVQTADPGQGELSRYDTGVLRRVYGRYKDHDAFDLSTLTHDFPEWQESYRGDRTATEIKVETILRDIGVQPSDVAGILAESEAEREYFAFAEEVESEA